MSKEKKGNMYSDIIPWNVCKGCNFNCSYCIPSYQRQAKRQMPKFDENGIQYRGCQKCYDYEPHIHLERLNKLPSIKEDQWIWAISSGDISCMKKEWIELVLMKVRDTPNKIFFFQTKDPSCYYLYEFPENTVLGITLETNKYPYKITNAPNPWHRYVFFKDYDFPRKVVTIEPILEFRFDIFLSWLRDINPERIYIGYNSKPKSIRLPESPLSKTRNLIKELSKFTTVKTKYMKEVIK